MTEGPFLPLSRDEVKLIELTIAPYLTIQKDYDLPIEEYHPDTPLTSIPGATMRTAQAAKRLRGLLNGYR